MTSPPNLKQTCTLAGLTITFLSKNAAIPAENKDENPLQDAPPELIIYLNAETVDSPGSEEIERIECFAPSGWQPKFKPIIKNQDCQLHFDMQTGHNAARCFFAAAKAAPNEDWNLILQPLLEFTLLEGRPVQSYKTTFLFPFTLKEKDQSTHRTASIREENAHSHPQPG